jgi:ABC-type transporter Mla maintaining outer membrane lipid asymmetry ATPase subunit MlaF
VFSVSNIHKFFGDNHVLRGVSLSVEPGEMIGLIGPSGAGKSVLLKIFAKVIEPDVGEVNLPFGERSVGYAFQEGGLFDSMTVLENTVFALQSNPRFSKGETEALQHRAYAVLERVGLAKHYKKLPGQLSGGMRKRLGIARAVVSDPELLIMDDPTAGLDPVASSVIMDLIRSIHETPVRGRTPVVIIISQDLRRLLVKVKRTVVLWSGEILFDGQTAALRRDQPTQLTRFIETRFDLSTL